MLYIAIAAGVFILSALLVFATTRKKHIGVQASERGVFKAQYFGALFAVSAFFTVVVMLVIKAVNG